MWKKFKKWVIDSPFIFLFYLWLFVGVPLGIALSFKDTTHKNKSFVGMSQCQAHYELLLHNTKFIDIHTSYYSMDGSDGNTPIFILNFKSKDDSFGEGYRGYDLCNLIATSWDRIEAYDAYVNNKK